MLQKLSFLRPLIVLIFFFLLNLIFGKLYLSRTQKFSDPQLALKQLLDQRTSVKYLAVGDSLTQHAYDPQIVDHLFNYGLVLENYVYSYYKIKWLYEVKGLKFDMVFLPYDLHSFSEHRLNHHPAPYFWNELIDLFDPELFHSRPIEDFAKRVLLKLFPYSGTYFEAKRMLQKNLPTSMQSGHVKLTRDYSKSPAADRLNETNSFFQRLLKKSNPLTPLFINYLNKTLSYLSKQGTKIVLVKHPISSEFFHIYNQWNRVHNHYRTLESLIKIPEGTVILDFQNRYFNKPEFFADYTHLNASGSKQFSQDLLMELQFSSLNYAHQNFKE